MGESFKEQDFLEDFKEAAKFCKFCEDYCEQSDSKGGNVHSRQALVHLGLIINPSKYSLIARSAEDACKGCGGKSTRIISILESYGIPV